VIEGSGDPLLCDAARVNVGAWLAHHAAQRADATAVIDEETGARLSYATLDERAIRFAASLRRLGVRAGERVAIAQPSTPDYLAVYFAAARIGAILVPLNVRLAPSELAHQLADSRPRVVLCESDLPLPPDAKLRRVSAEELLADLPARVETPALVEGGERPQVIMYTSGTTGHPKGAVLPHRKTLYNTLNARIYLELTPADVVVVPLPLFHSFGLKILCVPTLFAGATVVLVARFDPAGLPETVARHRASLLGAVPVMYRRMWEHGLRPEALRSLRFGVSAGAPIEPELIRRYAAAGVIVKQAYGQTETSILCCLDASDAVRKAGSVGTPVRHAEVRIANESGEALPAGTPGEVQVRGPIVGLGYWGRPEDTARSRIGGWHRTGDLGVADEEGCITLVGRLRELYISGGENVYPAEVERVLAAHPDVRECAVVGVPDPTWGEAGRAFVVPARTPFDADALLAWARERLARFKVPRDVVAVSELPRTASGKVQKHLLGAASDSSTLEPARAGTSPCPAR
jgi:fatty-acyl-CoA synthase